MATRAELGRRIEVYINVRQKYNAKSKVRINLNLISKILFFESDSIIFYLTKHLLQLNRQSTNEQCRKKYPTKQK